jgi:hypothetical protein
MSLPFALSSASIIGRRLGEYEISRGFLNEAFEYLLLFDQDQHMGGQCSDVRAGGVRFEGGGGTA